MPGSRDAWDGAGVALPGLYECILLHIGRNKARSSATTKAGIEFGPSHVGRLGKIPTDG
jgi:hypothetical protein